MSKENLFLVPGKTNHIEKSIKNSISEEDLIESGLTEAKIREIKERSTDGSIRCFAFKQNDDFIHKVEPNDYVVIFPNQKNNRFPDKQYIGRVIYKIYNENLGSSLWGSETGFHNIYFLTDLLTLRINKKDFINKTDYNNNYNIYGRIQVSDDKYKDVVNIILDNIEKYTYYTSIHNDSKDNEDKIGIKDETNNLAKVLCLKELKPPISILLTGKWGVGKSHFMKKLEDEVNNVTKYGQEIYHENMLNIKLNAWKISEDAIFSSILDQVITGIQDYLREKKIDIPKEIIKLNNKEKYILEKQKEGIEKEIDELEEKAIKVKNKITYKNILLKTIKNNWIFIISFFLIVFFILFSNYSNTIVRIAALLLPGLGVLKSAHKKTMQLRDKVESLKEESNFNNQENLIESIEKDISNLRIEKNNLKKQLENKDIEIKNEEKNRYMYFNSLILDNNYSENLSILNKVDEDLNKIEETINKDLPINQIILFIDDLDRCQPEKVAKLLQAINLLLTKKVFIVITAADENWIKKCIKQYYNFYDENKDDASMAIEYLEKIFQFSIKLCPWEKGYENYIKDLMPSNDYDPDEKKKSEAEIDEGGSKNNENKENQLRNKIKEIIVEHSAIKFTREETRTFNTIAKYVELTPRSIKKLVNIYRLIKVNNVGKNDFEKLIYLVFIFEILDKDKIMSLKEFISKDDQVKNIKEFIFYEQIDFIEEMSNNKLIQTDFIDNYNIVKKYFIL